ncbi:MAG TPA: hypothetical protein VFT50_01830 [Baekduia sp.]|nr:hypothetical protein [Baekduia sp.]
MLVTCALAGAVAPAAAHANATEYWNAFSGGSGLNGRHGDLTRTELTGSWGLDWSTFGQELWVGAHYSGSLTLYASWAVGTDNACHNYGSNNVGAMFETPYREYGVRATSGWLGDLGPNHC